MDEELTPEQKFAAESPEATVPRDLLLGRSPEEIIADLVRLDWSARSARSFVTHVQRELDRFRASPEARRTMIGSAWTQFLVGLLTGAIGLGLTAMLLLVSLSIVLLAPAWIGFAGLVIMSRGWSRWRFYKQLAKALDDGEPTR